MSMATAHAVRLKVFEKHDCGALAEKQQIFASNMASKCTVLFAFGS